MVCLRLRPPYHNWIIYLRMPIAPRVGIVVLNYNGKECLPVCLTSLSALVYPKKDIIVVDNASHDHSFNEAKKQFPDYVYIQNAKNEGFAKGMNLGIRLALERGAEWVWIFNYDAVASPKSLEHLITVANSMPKAGLLSPLIYDANGKDLWFANGKISFWRMRTLHIPPTQENLTQTTYSSNFLTGCALLIKKELIESIGFLDERFFLYYEDADYSLRAIRAGFACLVVPGAVVSHSEVSRKNFKKSYFLVYSGLLFFQKWTPFFMRPYISVYVTIRRVKNSFDRIFRKKGATQEVYLAYRKYFHERQS